MRPVTVPDPPQYSENCQKNVKVAKPSATKKRGPDVKKQEVLDILNNLINSWVLAGCKPTKSGTPDFANEKDKNLYDDASGQLTAGGHDWGDARSDLIQAIGAYCSYCGSPIYSHLAIEHRLPKNTFPLRAFDYNNFLLACATCNSAKGNKPNQADFKPPVTTDTASNYIENIGGIHYLWANYDWSTIPLPSPFPFKCTLNWLESFRNTLRFGALIDLSGENELLGMFKAGTLGVDNGHYYQPCAPSGMGKKKFGVQIIADPAVSDTLKEAVNRIIELASLNKIVKAGDSCNSVDRRIETRTRAFFTARIVKQQLTDAAAPDSASLLPAVIEQAKQTIRATGQWLIWLSVLGNDPYSGVPAQTLIRQGMVGTSAVDWTV